MDTTLVILLVIAVLIYVFYYLKSKTNKPISQIKNSDPIMPYKSVDESINENIQDESLTFEVDPDPSDHIKYNVKDILDKNYSPRSTILEIEVNPLNYNNHYSAGDEVELIFKKKEAYYQDYFIEVGFKHQGALFAIEGQSYDSTHPLIRLVRANLTGFEITAFIKEAYDWKFKIEAHLIKEGYELKKSQTSRKPKTSNKQSVSKSKFEVSGIFYLNSQIQDMIKKELRVGDQLKLIPEPENRYDNTAIKVMFKEYHIGWVSKYYYKKNNLFKYLNTGNEIKVTCCENSRIQTRKGMAQFIEVEVEVIKE